MFRLFNALMVLCFFPFACAFGALRGETPAERDERTRFARESMRIR